MSTDKTAELTAFWSANDATIRSADRTTLELTVRAAKFPTVGTA